MLFTAHFIALQVAFAESLAETPLCVRTMDSIPAENDYTLRQLFKSHKLVQSLLCHEYSNILPLVSSFKSVLMSHSRILI